ncbi:MAG: hypothetical protein EOM05_07810 [Clostridia bacterium]|nr:hypothetical protein [Clostridia bacterium]
MTSNQHYLTLDKYERGVMIKALSKFRDSLISKHHPTDLVDELIIKTADVSKKKFRVIERMSSCHEER